MSETPPEGPFTEIVNGEEYTSIVLPSMGIVASAPVDGADEDAPEGPFTEVVDGKEYTSIVLDSMGIVATAGVKKGKGKKK